MLAPRARADVQFRDSGTGVLIDGFPGEFDEKAKKVWDVRIFFLLLCLHEPGLTRLVDFQDSKPEDLQSIKADAPHREIDLE